MPSRRAPRPATAICSATDVVKPTAHERLGPNGLVASISTLPLTSPSEAATVVATCQGTASRITSAAAAAALSPAADAPAPLAFTRACTLSPCGSREPNTTVCPPSAQRRPSTLPTLPVPITAIFIRFSFLCIVKFASGCAKHRIVRREVLWAMYQNVKRGQRRSSILSDFLYPMFISTLSRHGNLHHCVCMP